jgi:hypothetical protein
VTGVETPSFIGRHDPKDTPFPQMLLVASFTIHKLDPRHKLDRMTLSLSDIRLEAVDEGGLTAEVPTMPAGIPLEAPGGKVLIEGDNLRICLQSDPDTGELAVGAAVVFQVPKGGERRLRIADFQPVSIHWGEAGTVADDSDLH